MGQVGCSIVAIIVHFTNLAIFFWTNVMAWDIYKTFGQRTVLSHIRPKEIHFPRYFAYGFGIQMMIVIFCVVIDYSGFLKSFAIEYGHGGCWIGNNLASFIFFCLPMLYVSVSNIAFYLLTVASINYVSSLTESSRNRERGRSDLFIYLRIFVVLGITWIFGIIVKFTTDGSIAEKVIILCFVITDSLQGFFLFWIFTFNQRVFSLYKRLFVRMKNRASEKREEQKRLSLKASMIKERCVETKQKPGEVQSNKEHILIQLLKLFR